MQPGRETDGVRFWGTGRMRSPFLPPAPPPLAPPPGSPVDDTHVLGLPPPPPHHPPLLEGAEWGSEPQGPGLVPKASLTSGGSFWKGLHRTGVAQAGDRSPGEPRLDTPSARVRGACIQQVGLGESQQLGRGAHPRGGCRGASVAAWAEGTGRHGWPRQRRSSGLSG